VCTNTAWNNIRDASAAERQQCSLENLRPVRLLSVFLYCRKKYVSSKATEMNITEYCLLYT